MGKILWLRKNKFSKFIALSLALSLLFTLFLSVSVSAMVAFESKVPDLRGGWYMNTNGYNARIDIKVQDGTEFTGEMYFENFTIPDKIVGSINGDTVIFDRICDSNLHHQLHIQTHEGKITIDSNNNATMSGTFVQYDYIGSFDNQTAGPYDPCNWSLIKDDPITNYFPAVIVPVGPEQSKPTSTIPSGIIDLRGGWKMNTNGYNARINIKVQNGTEFTGEMYWEYFTIPDKIVGSINGDTVIFDRICDSNLHHQLHIQTHEGKITIDSNNNATMSGTFVQYDYIGSFDNQTAGPYDPCNWSLIKDDPITNYFPAVTVPIGPEQSKPTSTIPSGIIDMRGIWDTKHNRDVYSGTLNVQNQDGNEFTGEINIDGSSIEKLTKGSIEGNVMKFTRQWSGGGLWQDYVGTITIDASGYIRAEGTFTQSGGSTIYDWWAVKREPLTHFTPTIPVQPVEPKEPEVPFVPTPASTDTGAEAFESGTRLMWPSVQNILGYRLYRSENQGQLGISVTDFYITSTSYADVNVKPSTTYYYSVKPVLAEADPFNDIEEKLGDVIATFVITTGSEIIYNPDSTKHFIMLKLDSPYMSVDGENREVDPGRGTCPIIIAGRTMVPIRAVVEAMNGTVGWDQGTKLITLNARGNKVEMWLDKTDIKVNGVAKEMDIAPVARDGRTYVPVRFAAENLNCKVDWINSTKEAIIVYEK